MKIKLFLVSGLLALTPLISSAQVNANITISGSAVTGNDLRFDVQLSNFETVSNTLSVLTILGAAPQDIKTASYTDQTGSQSLMFNQEDTNMVATFPSNVGSVINLAINFKTPKTYVIGYALTAYSGRVLASAAIPLTVGGQKILGQSTAVTFTRSFRVGSSGADVTALQNKLTAEGFYKGPITGYFGSLTRAAVMKYQAAHGITTNGVVGPQTLAALNK